MIDARRTPSRPRFAAVWCSLLLAGCYQGLDDPSASGGNSADAGEDADDDAGEGADDGDDGVPADELPAPTTRVFRLTHAQWDNTVRDLFYLAEPLGLAEEFRSDPSVGGFMFDNNALSLEVDQALWQNYRAAAGNVAELVTADQTILDGILPPDGGDAAARADQFVRELGRRAYRRPLEEAEVTELTALFGEAPELYDGMDPFLAGVRLAIETMLQSPHFLYRVETSTEPDGDVIPLGDFELASRMSYFLWNTMPDDELLDAAEAEALTAREDIETQARRMLADARAVGVMHHFHDQLLEVEKAAAAMPSPMFYPNVSTAFGEHAVEETRMFVDDVILGRDGTFVDLMTSNETFVNSELATIYGLQGEYGDEFVPATLDAAQRRGLFTLTAFLAGNSTSVNPDPIHRGVFIAKRMLCMVIAAPPDGVPPLPPPEGRSNRQTVEEHTQQPGSNCAGCHETLINPFGFPYENYDAVGAWRTVDNGFDVDASSEITLDGAVVQIPNALGLADALASSPTAHSCYMNHWIEFANGRPLTETDEPLSIRLGGESLADSQPIGELLVGLVTSKAFRNRATEELP
jgi:hypothetical protein